MTPAHTQEAHRTSMGLDSRKMAFWAFIGSECLLFGSLISTYLVYKGRSLTGPFPHEILNIPFTSFSTFDLLMSSLAMVLALAAVQRGDMKQGKLWLLVTALLGLVFLGGQFWEFSHFVHEGLGLTTNLFGSTFYVLTGTHGAHVTVGVIWLLTLWVQALRGKLGPANAMTVEITGLYWHFVDVVWIVIFTVVYLIQCEEEHERAGARDDGHLPAGCRDPRDDHADRGGHFLRADVPDGARAGAAVPFRGQVHAGRDVLHASEVRQSFLRVSFRWPAAAWRRGRREPPVHLLWSAPAAYGKLTNAQCPMSNVQCRMINDQ